MIGQQVGQYHLVEKLGEGGMGVVYKGVDTHYGHEVAIKALHPTLMVDAQLRERFIREAQALARLNHPNVVRLLDFVNRGDTCFIIMEFIHGQNVEEVLQSRGLIPPLEAAEHFVQVLAAAHYAHGLGIIHRDIKPANIAVLESGQVKLLDFGTAKVVDAHRLTQANMTLGTVVYMSPEQVCGRDLDHRSDIYSLGVTLYEMVTCRLPHECENESQLFMDIVKGKPLPPSKHYPPLPKQLERIIIRAIEKDPARRYQTAEEFLQAIRGFIQHEKKEEAKKTPPSGVFIPAGPMRGGAGAGETIAEVPSRAYRRTIALSGVGVGLAASGALAGAAGLVGGAVTVPLALSGVAVYAVAVLWPVSVRPALTPAKRRPLAVGEQTLDQEPEQSLVVSAPEVDDGAPPPPAPLAGEAIQLDRQPSPAAAQGWAQEGGVDSQGVPRDAHAAATAVLYVFEGPDQGQSWVLPQGAITLGRGKHNTIVLSDGGVSTTHAQIGFDGERYVITDLESRNGTFVNSSQVKSFPLGDRDVIVMGQTKLAVAFQ
jgi:serine/threonine-protein kinase